MNEPYQSIDIRHWPQTGLEELKKGILDAVKDTQSVLIRPLPNELIMTPDQYDLLQPDPEMKGMYESQQRVYMPWDPIKRDTVCAMDVVIREL